MATVARPTLCFVCTGNVCRSPMAEHLLRHHLGPAAPWRVVSAGLSATPGLPASPEAVAVLRERGLDLTPHRSRPLTREIIDACTLVVVMTDAHARETRQRFPDAPARIVRLTAFDPRPGAGGDIGDPIGLSVDGYRRTRDEIDEVLLDLILALRRR